MTALQPSAAAPYQGSGPGGSGAAATPLYDALVTEYQQALRCVPGEYRFENRMAAQPSLLPGPSTTAHGSGFHYQFDGLTYARRAHGVPRQVSRHRGTPEDGQGLTQTAVR